MAYGSFKDSPRGTASYKALHNKVFNIATKDVLLQWFTDILISLL